jgi:uncharacterized membrane protein YdbT with pleckstrin-like domain
MSNLAESTPSELPTQPEQDLFDIRPSAKAFLGQIILGILLIPVFLIGLIVLLNVWYRVLSLRYRLTTERLFMSRGLIAKSVEELELFRVKDITVRQGILQRLLGVGVVTILSTDDTNPQLSLSGIDRPVEIKEMIRTQCRAARKHESVRSTEFIPS